MKLDVQLRGEAYLDRVASRWHELVDPLWAFAHDNWIIAMAVIAAIWWLFSVIDDFPEWLGVTIFVPFGITFVMVAAYVGGGDEMAGMTAAIIVICFTLAALAWASEGIVWAWNRAKSWWQRTHGT